MNRVRKNISLDMFSFTELIVAFTVITLALSINMGYLHQLKTNTAAVDSLEYLYLLNAFTLLSMLVTAIGIMGLQLTHVYRMRDEIGLHKAFGACTKDVIRLILMDTLRLIIIPAALGVIIGILMAGFLPFHRINLKARINLQLFLGCGTGLFIFTGLSGILPALRAALMDPVQILRKHTDLRKETTGRRGSFLYYLIMLAVIVTGIYVNHEREAAFQKDVMMTAGTPPAVSEQVPLFTFQDQEGNRISSETLKGRNYCLVIWGTDCPVSKNALSYWEEIMKEDSLKEMAFYMIEISSSLREAKNYIREHGLSMDSYTDDQKSVKWAFHASTLPMAYVVDKDGIIRARSIGWSEAVMDYLVKQMKYSLEQE